MSKKYKKKTRGVRYISNILKKYYPVRYKDSKERSARAKELLSEFKEKGLKVGVKTIRTNEHIDFSSKFKTKRKKQKLEAPKLPDSLTELSSYFDLTNYKDKIRAVVISILFISRVSDPSLPLIEGGTSQASYSKYFKDFVDYINRRRQEYIEEDYDHDWYVRCTEPEYNSELNRWTSEIISCNADGREDDYGFYEEMGYTQSGITPPSESKKGKKSDSKPSKSKKDKIPEPPKEIIIQPKSDRELKQIELENKREQLKIQKQRQENIQNALKLFGEGKLTKLEFKEIMSSINKGNV